jgi:hypothetical protein
LIDYLSIKFRTGADLVTLKELATWLTPAEAGREMGMSKQAAIKRLEQKTLRGVKTHQGWLVDPEDARRVAHEQPRGWV